MCCSNASAGAVLRADLSTTVFVHPIAHNDNKIARNDERRGFTGDLRLPEVRDVDRASRHAAALQDLESRDEDRSFVEALAAGAEARIAWANGDAATALARLDRSRPTLWFQQAVASPFYAQAFERYMRAELLAAEGRQREAVGWFESLVERTPFELIYQPEVERCLGEMPTDVLGDE